MDRHLDQGIAGDYAEGILDPTTRASVDAHLLGCADCRREVASASAYFRDMAGLEPIKAPENFLANVRARLPGESPWRRAVSAMARPWRVLPLQLALATLIGVTAVSVYVRQGGMEPETMATSIPTPAKEDSAPEVSQIVPPPAEPPLRPKSNTPEKDAARPLGRRSVQHPDGKNFTATEGKPAGNADGVGSASRLLKGSADDARPESPAPSASRGDESRPNVDVQFDKESESRDSKPSARPAPAEAAADKGAFYESAEGGYPSLSPQSSDAPEESRAAPKPKMESDTRKRAAPASAPVMPARASGYSRPQTPADLTVRLRSANDLDALKSGVEAMGIKVENVLQPAGGPRRWRLIFPGSTLPDLKAYLARYGTLTGVVPASPRADSMGFDLLIISP